MLARIARHRYDLAAVAVLVCAAFVAHYYFFPELGLYEDDYAVATPGFSRSWEETFRFTLGTLRGLPQGRPFHFMLVPLLAKIGLELGGFQTIFLLGWGIVAVNAVLVYTLLRRMGVLFFALVGALVFVLFPSDTTRPFLAHTLGIQPGVTLLLVSLLLYPTRWRPVAFLTAIGALLTYEFCFLPFLAAPLLQTPWDRKRGRELLIHVAVCLGIVVTMFAIRRYRGEVRVSEQLPAPFTLATQIVGGMVLGPLTSLYLTVYRLGTTVRGLDSSLLPVIALSGAVFFFVLWRMPRPPFPTAYGLSPSSRLGDLTVSFGSHWAQAVSRSGLKLPVLGLVLMVIAYAFSFRHFPPTILAGRVTSMHIGAILGGAILVGWLATTLVQAVGKRGSALAIGLIAVWLALWVGFGWIVQRDLANAWRAERIFWSQVLKLAPDVDNETLVLVARASEPQAKYISVHSYADSFLLDQIYLLQGREKQKRTRLFVVTPTWSEEVETDGARFHLPVQVQGGFYSAVEELTPGKVILLEQEGAKVTRRTGYVMMDGHRFELKPVTADGPPPISNPLLLELFENSLP